MGSQLAVEKFITASKPHGVTCEWIPANTVMSFANSQVAWLEWAVKVTFPTEPPVSTIIDVHPDGRVPILMSLGQMMKLHMTLTCSPVGVSVSCAALNYKDHPLKFSTSKHVILDLCDVKNNTVSGAVVSTDEAHGH